MQTIRATIVDDEPLARERIATLLAREVDIEIVAHCGNGEEALRSLAQKGTDLLFLDVQMPRVNGFEVLRRLEGSVPATIFVTAFD